MFIKIYFDLKYNNIYYGYAYFQLLKIETIEADDLLNDLTKYDYENI